MDVLVLGPVEVSVRGHSIALGVGKPRALFAMLAINAGSPVSADRLIEGLWGEDPPATAPKMLQAYVSQLRKVLPQDGGGEILTRGRGYELRLGPDDVDVRRFERLVAQGAPREALELWRGPPLDDVADEPFALVEVRRLEEMRLAATEAAVEADLAAGRHRELVGELEILTFEEPLRERLHAQRMLALYRCGRQADALDAYGQARATLVGTIGVEPGPELRQLHEAILRQDPSLDPPGAGAEAARRLGVAAERAATERTSLRAAEEDLAGHVVALQATREPPEGIDAEAGVLACPFKGLASFDIDEAEVFFGRERLVAEMVARLVGAPLMGIVGRSGSGKSSALRAGLLAALRGGVLPGSERWALALLRPGEHPIRALGTAIEDAGPEGRLIVAVDQFEEAFTACRDEAERSGFVDALVAHARDARRRTVVLIALRADFYGRCDEYPGFSRLLGANHVLVGSMRRDELRRAIELPARRAGLRPEPALVEALVDDVDGEPGALPLLATTLLEIWQHRDGRDLRLTAYERAGGVHGAVGRLAERAYERLEPESRDVARRILLCLAGAGEGDAIVRQRVELADLGTDSDPAVAAVLSVLADERLVTVGDGGVEVAHEALLREWPRLRGWLEEDEHGRRLHRRLRTTAHEWDDDARDPGELYRGARLASAIDWSATHWAELTSAERAFLAASRAASERSHHRLQAVLVGVALLLVVAVAAGLVALDQRGTARSEAKEAEAERLGTRALVERNLDRAVLLARQGVALDDNAQTRANLLAALVKSPAAIGVLRGDGERIWTAELSPDERTLAAGDPAGNIFLFDLRTRRRLATFKPANTDAWIVNMAFSPDGGRLAVGHDTAEGNIVTVMDTRTRRPVLRLRPPKLGFVYGVQYTSGGRWIDVVTRGYTEDHSPAMFTRFDARTGRRLLGPQAINRDGGTPVMVTADGRRLVAGGAGEITVRDLATLRVLRRLGVGGDPDATDHTNAYALSPDDRTVAIGDPDGSVRLLDLESGLVRAAPGGHTAAVTQLQFTPDSRSLVSASDDGNVIVWDVRKAAAAEILSGHGSGVRSPQITRDGKTLYTAGLDGTVFIWDLAGDRRLGRPFSARPGSGDGEFAFALSSDGRLFASGETDGTIGIVEMSSLARRARLPALPIGDSLRVAFVPGSRLMVVGGAEGFLALVDVDTGRIIGRLRGHRGDLYTPGISADGRLLATSARDEDTVRLWSLPDGRPRGVLRFRRFVFDAQVSPDGRWVTVVLINADHQDGAVEVWDARTRRRVRSVRVDDFPGFTRYSPDGRLVAVGNRFGVTHVWSTATWEPVTRPLVGEASRIVSAAFSSDGRTLATGNDTGALRLWDVRTGRAVGAPLPGVPSQVVRPFFTPDGKRLIAAYAGGRAYLWDIRPESHLRHACAVAGRRLTREEWGEFLPGRAYDPAC